MRDDLMMDEGEDMDDGQDFDQLTKEQKYQVIQELYQQYQNDPEKFPEEQRELLERELENLFQQEGEGEYDDDMMMDDDDRMQIDGQINFPNQQLPLRQDEGEGEDDQDYDQAPSPPKQEHKEQRNAQQPQRQTDQKQQQQDYGQEDEDDEEPDEAEKPVVNIEARTGQFANQQHQMHNQQEEEEIDPQQVLAMQQMMMKNQMALKKKKKKVTKKRPQSAGKHNPAARPVGRHQNISSRPQTAKPAKKKKKVAKGSK